MRDLKKLTITGKRIIQDKAADLTAAELLYLDYKNSKDHLAAIEDAFYFGVAVGLGYTETMNRNELAVLKGFINNLCRK